MKIINLIGGLGNQMFQYAFSLAVMKHYPNEEVLIDIHHLESLYEYGFELKKVFPNLECQIASKKQVRKVSRYSPTYKISRIVRNILPARKSEFLEKDPEMFDPEVFQQLGDTYFEGYWHAYKYFEDIIPDIREQFVFPQPSSFNLNLSEELLSCKSVGLHVRRGDYLKARFADLGEACNLDYYKSAISLLHEKSEDYHFYIFSNDIEWCRKEIIPLLKTDRVTVVTENTGINSNWDMYLMSHCHYLIMANSTFSWWGAVLNRNNPMVIVPKNWKVGVPSDTLCAPDWIRL